MRIRKLSTELGTELLDYDPTRPSSPEEQAQLRALFCEHHLLLIRGQAPTIADQDRFTRYFGPLSLMRNGEHAGHVSNLGPDKDYDGAVVTGQSRLLWHADGTYGVNPGIGTSLLAVEVTPETTPTQFVSAAGALQRLPPALRQRIEGLKAVHYRKISLEQTNKRIRIEDIPADEAKGATFRGYEQPLIYRLPHAEIDVLFVNELATSHIVGLDPQEGEGLIQELFSQIYQAEYVYTHHWQPGDLLIWDNIALQHCRPQDLGEAPRHLRRLSLDGWNGPDGVLDWPASGTVRDKAEAA
ncbi:MAG: TauD/TfdA dioxygenase family protein [Novosphingobium sp.]